MKVIYYPEESSLNKYISISQECLKELGIDVLPFSIKDVLSGKVKAEYLILNWYENIGNSDSSIFLWFRVIKKIIKLYVFKVRGIKIIFTFHNKIPHGTKKLFPVRKMISMLCKLSDKVIILSKASKKELEAYLSKNQIEKKVYYIPHPNYIGQYPCLKTERAREQDGKLHFLFVGAVKPYKNIELILELARKFEKEQVVFHIAGMPCDEQYKKVLEEKISGRNNIELTLRFLEDDEIAEYVIASDVLLLPYDMKSSLNSGTVMLAFSYGKTIICPRIATVQDFEEDLMFTYEYETEEQHSQKLEEQIKKVIELEKFEPGKLDMLGEKLKSIVAEKNSVDAIKEKYRELLWK